MARRKAIFNSKETFKPQEFEVNGMKFVPYLYYDGENFPTDEAYQSGSFPNSIQWVGGQPNIVDGIVNKAAKFVGNALIWRNWDFPSIEKMSMSFWVKFNPTDFNSWTILATTRGDNYSSDYGFHVAVFTSGALNIRVYSDTGSYDAYSNSTGQSGKVFEANKWYHVNVVFDGTNVKGIVNGEEWISFYAGNFQYSPFERSFTLGDMLSASGGNTFPFNGIIDEFMFAFNENAISPQQAVDYYNKTKDGEFVDYWTKEGSIQLGKGLSGSYPSSVVSWTSPTIDLGGKGKFVDFGFIEATGVTTSTTTLHFYTRSSNNGSSWGQWSQVAEDGKILSPNVRYLQVRVDMQSLDGNSTPVLDELRIMEDDFPIGIIPLPNTNVNADDHLILYRDLESGLESLGTLKNAYDIIIEEEINGEDTLTFNLPVNDKKRKEIGEEPVEMIAEIGQRYYVVKEIIDKRDNGGKLYSQFNCEARWTELRDWYVQDLEVVTVTAREALEAIFSNIFREAGDPHFDWKLGNVEMTRKRTLRTEWSDVLSLIHNVQNTWGGEVLFDTKTKTVHLLEKIGNDTGIRFYYNKNLKDIERTIDTYDLVTRIYPTGKGGLDITSVNNGVQYLENRTWVDKLKLRRKIIPYRWSDERYTIPTNLKEDGQRILDEMAKPKVAYKTSIHDLSKLAGHEHESFNLGDLVTVVDKELFEEEIVNRIVRRKQDVRKPENTEVELSQPMKTLADIRSRAMDDQIQTLLDSDPLSTTDVHQMTVFNNLLNSRADDGFNSWVHEANGTQFEIANAGFSGSWSYKVTPDYGKEATLTQTVEGVSHRSSYTVSAAVATEGTITRGSSDDAFVGIKVLVYYEGEQEPEVHYLGIPDITQTEDEEEIDEETIDEN